MLTCLVYASEATVPFGDADLLDLLRRSRENNGRLGIGGLLLYMKGSFMQALEGERETVLPLYERIRRDPRHGRVTTLIRFTMEERAFADWSMAFTDMDRLSEADREGFSPFLEPSFTDRTYVERPHQAIRLLQRFKERMVEGGTRPLADWWY
jgi:hypothetical protein